MPREPVKVTTIRMRVTSDPTTIHDHFTAGRDERRTRKTDQNAAIVSASTMNRMMALVSTGRRETEEWTPRQKAGNTGGKSTNVPDSGKDLAAAERAESYLITSPTSVGISHDRASSRRPHGGTLTPLRGARP